MPYPLALPVPKPRLTLVFIRSLLADPTSLVLLGSTTASQRVLAAAQAAEFGGKEKALTGFRGFLASSCMVSISHGARTSFHFNKIITSSVGIVDGSDFERVALGHIM